MNYAQGAGPGSAMPHGQQAGTRPERRKRKLPWVLGGVGVIVVMAIVVGAVTVLMGGTDGTSSSRADAVRTYLRALSKADAKGALAVMAPPTSKLLLTDEVLTKQRAKAPITEMEITSGGTTEYDPVKATYKLGDKYVQADFRVTGAKGNYKLEQGTADFKVDDVDNIPDLTAFGVDVSNQTTISVFPGPIDWGSANPDLTVEVSDADSPREPTDYVSFVTFTAALSATGKAKVAKAVDTFIAYCAESKDTVAATDRPGCTQATVVFDLLPGSETWSADQASVADLDVRPDYSTPTKVEVAGLVRWNLAYRKRDNSPVTVTDPAFLSGGVDLAAANPVFTR